MLTAGSEWKHCPAIRDESDNCDVFYSYHYNPDIKTVQVQQTKRTFTPPTLYRHLNQWLFSEPVVTCCKDQGSPYSITERMVPELIPVLGSQPAGDLNHKPGCHYFPPGPQLPPQPLRGLLPVSLLDEQMHDGCEQFA